MTGFLGTTNYRWRENDDENETAISRFKYLSKIFKNNVTIIHGRMNKEEIDFNMNSFLEKKKMILVSTTVIEVGVNIPSATLMIIENANRFGLSQLHQLRKGCKRVQSHCILIHNRIYQKTQKRLVILKIQIMVLKLRKRFIFKGSGDFLGQISLVYLNGDFLHPIKILIFLKNKN